MFYPGLYYFGFNSNLNFYSLLKLKKMKHSELMQGQKYFDISDKKVPLIFNGSKLKNQGFNSFVFQCEFTPVATEQNKNYNLPKIIYKCFPEEGSRDDIKKFN